MRRAIWPHLSPSTLKAAVLLLRASAFYRPLTGPRAGQQPGKPCSGLRRVKHSLTSILLRARRVLHSKTTWGQGEVCASEVKTLCRVILTGFRPFCSGYCQNFFRAAPETLTSKSLVQSGREGTGSARFPENLRKAQTFPDMGLLVERGRA
jgi:hypothetical protein